MGKFMFRLAGAAALAAIAVTGCACMTEATDEAGRTETGYLSGLAGGEDNDELFEGYISGIFYDGGGDTLSLYSSDYGASIFEGSIYEAYSELKGAVADIASGEVESTAITLSTNLEWDKDELGISSEDIVELYTTDDMYLLQGAVFDAVWAYYSCLLEDCPYELYWFDKTTGLSWSYKAYMDGGTIGIRELKIKMYVAEGYQGDDNLTVDTSGVQRAVTAAGNAKAIVEAHADESDMEKLTSYKDEICGLVSYNYAAVLLDEDYGDPWQLVYVFDGDEDTDVVCEGYSKAFQYLFELSDFEAEDAACYTVSGYAKKQHGVSTSTSSHMWNVITLDGTNYMADITNSDTGMAGHDGSRFMVTDADAESYMPGTYYVFSGTRYTYMSKTTSLLSPGILTLGTVGQAYGDSLVARSGTGWNYIYALRSGYEDVIVDYGEDVGEVLFGDWDGDGVDTACARVGNAYYFINSLSAGETDLLSQADTVIYFGRAADKVLAGDWDGDGCDTLMVRRGSTCYFINSLKSGAADEAVSYGRADDTVLAGDWDGDGVDTLCIRRGHVYYFSNDIDSGGIDKVIAYGRDTDSALVGDWDGDGTDTLTVRRGNTCYISNSLKSGAADLTVAYGKATDEVYAGRWY